MKDGHFSFQTHLNWRVFSWSLFRADRIFQVHDMTINFFFCSLFSSFIHPICLLRATTHVAYGLPSWSIFSYVRIVFKDCLLIKGLFMSFLSKERIMARKYSRKMHNFGQRAPRHQSKWFRSIAILGLVFLVIEKVWQVWSYGKSWCIPNYQLSVSFKNSSFFVA